MSDREAPVTGRSTQDGGHFRLEQLADGVYVALAEPSGFALCNGGIVDLGGTTVVFDAMLTPQAGEALGRAAERLTGRRPSLLVTSHYHGDHVRGSAAVGARHIVATAKVRDLVVERASAHLASDRLEAERDLPRIRSGELPLPPEDRVAMEGWLGGILATPPDLGVPSADVTFESELRLHGVKRSARVLTFGGGHSPSDVLLQLPDEQVTFLGDLLSVGFHPSIGDGTPSEFLRILDRVRALPAGRSVPGHGPVGDDASLETMQRYIARLLATARAARESGTDRETFAQRPPEPPFDDWRLSPIYPGNARFAYDLAGPGTSP